MTMKNKMFGLALASLVWLLSSQHTIAQPAYDEYVVKQNMERLGYTLRETFYADLKEGETASRWHTFYAGSSYLIAAFPTEEGVADVDVSLYNDDGSLIEKDHDTKAFAVISRDILSTRPLKILIKNYDSYNSY
jgi:hypothetical protein